ncbi:hypothetical protein SDJN02_11608, partial [Cucurbita argyrosperma subsp. argyrosperma]
MAKESEDEHLELMEFAVSSKGVVVLGLWPFTLDEFLQLFTITEDDVNIQLNAFAIYDRGDHVISTEYGPPHNSSLDIEHYLPLRFTLVSTTLKEDKIRY